jgi:hypothetical protein
MMQIFVKVAVGMYASALISSMDTIGNIVDF